jgi:RecB family exonuclease
MTETTTIDWRDLPPVDEAERPLITPGWQPSQTFLRTHDRCDRAAMLYLNYAAGAGSHELNRGAIVHEVIARLTRLAVEHGEGRLDSPEIAKDELLDYLREHPNLQLSAAERDACRYMVSNWAVGEYFDPEAVIAIETPISLEVGGYVIEGHPDRAEDVGGGTIEITDYKTSFAPPDDFKTQAFDPEGRPFFAGNFQTQIYALLVAFGTFPDGMTLGDGFERFKLRLAFPRHLRAGSLLDRVAVITRAQLLDFKLDLESQLQRLTDVNLGEGKWQPTPGSHCRECPAEFACPLPRILRPEAQHAQLDSIEALERAAASAWFMGERAKVLKRRVKKAAERLAESDPEALDLGDGEKGVRIGRDLAYVFVPTQREELDKTGLFEAIEAAKLGGDEVNPADFYKRTEGVGFEKVKVGPK